MQFHLLGVLLVGYCMYNTCRLVSRLHYASLFFSLSTSHRFSAGLLRENALYRKIRVPLPPSSCPFISFRLYPTKEGAIEALCLRKSGLAT